MVRDLKYIIKRVIIGVLIALILGFLSTRKVSALTSNFDSVLMCSNNMGCNTSLSLPYSYSYSDSARLNFSGINLIQGKTYNINFSMTLISPSFSFNLDYPQLFVIDSSGNPVRAYPDRGNSLQVNNLGSNNYSVNWSFELDNTGGNFTSVYVIFVFTSQYNQNIYSTTINSSSFLYYDLSDPTGNQDIINNQNNNTQNIINNNNSNTQDIINNQNENTEKEIESQKVCSIYNTISIDNKYLNLSGGEISSTNFGISDYINIYEKDVSIHQVNSYYSGMCYYTDTKQVISCVNISTLSDGDLSPPSNAHYLRFSIRHVEFTPFIKVCSNGNQVINDQMQDINNTINDDSSPDTNSFIEGLLGIFPNSTPITDLLTLPITLLNVYIDKFDDSCVAFDLGELYGSHLILPCIDLEDRLGSSLWSQIDSLCCLFMIFNIGMLCVSIYENITNLNDTIGSLYQPQHADYKPKHGG